MSNNKNPVVESIVQRHKTKDSIFTSQMKTLSTANIVIGVLVMLFIGHKWCDYLELLHENQTWFSNVSQLLREISFRTEQGLYYSYFKDFVQSPSMEEGWNKLRYDNVTENTKTINIFHRFNIYQELFLGVVYSVYDFGLEPIFFYIKATFALQGILMMAFYLISWRISGTWVAGIVTSAYVVCLRTSVTRVEYTIALREHFSLPFIFLQFASVGYYLKLNPKGNEKIHLVLNFGLSLLFTICWQFSQFVLLLESGVLFMLGMFRIVDRNKITKILVSHSFVIVSTWYFQYYQPMVLSSLVLSFIPVAVIFLHLQEPPMQKYGFVNELISYVIRSIGHIVLALIITICINMLLKYGMDQHDDNHILHFIKSKLGFTDQTNFDTRLYLCLSAFQTLPMSELYAFVPNLSLILYILLLIIGLASFILTIAKRILVSQEKKTDKDEENKDNSVSLIKKIDEEAHLHFLTNIGDRPEFIFHLCMSLILGALAISTFRMKCFWSPYILICASACICDFHLWNAFLSHFIGKEKSKASKNLTQFVRHMVLLFLILHLYISHKESLREELEDLRELHDPDTVDLMQWIKQFTPKDAVFTGSMQLLAGVKLCTSRRLTNHPHFEDKDLRIRTKELYSIYSKISPEEVYQILRKYDTSYIILEDSICMAPPSNRCSLNEIMDLTNGFIPSDGIKDLPHLKQSLHPLFCDEIRYARGAYKKYFNEVFSNRTFRVYKVKK
ncbi:protein C-mannosyl-transferase DPY19L3 isoform X2 [Lepeophtheirus salmonis]|uniref:protein C-mannosyl-transferase DPY19L3 isoform X2 n=1 Tax=Lepeophtheirus salmonis TaxID=72036 RepID=UPI001AE376CB|nr:probable C-mannosyltransferase DPY19L3 isoform X2 [Lepeophtheirus salmonis]